MDQLLPSVRGAGLKSNFVKTSLLHWPPHVVYWPFTNVSESSRLSHFITKRRYHTTTLTGGKEHKRLCLKQRFIGWNVQGNTAAAQQHPASNDSVIPENLWSSNLLKQSLLQLFKERKPCTSLANTGQLPLKKKKLATTDLISLYSFGSKETDSIRHSSIRPHASSSLPRRGCPSPEPLL